MKQFKFDLINKRTGAAESVQVTAQNEAFARINVVNYYGSTHHVASHCCDVNPPHRYACEIDCADFTAADYAWLSSIVAARGQA